MYPTQQPALWNGPLFAVQRVRQTDTDELPQPRSICTFPRTDSSTSSSGSTER
ncbi:predicted protein [Plenodomus lingam JN3]|uniref:Predicted protein n=1 Tax=Leptosphaeria maculans (strain JN3 / isolate v23.1.3 / race Av1-4-5-6-7-8) TaxID=985895 RepID=E5ABK2_LEPMJ|nr:predicted protein [Plenodomus lingam JN3]CBY01043.1 predicted protein [Plenodomus lingam JN3]